MERKPITILPKYLDRIDFLPEDCRDAMITAIVYYGAEKRFPTFDKFEDRDRQFLIATFSGIKGFLDESMRKRDAGKLGGENGDGEAKNRYIDEPIASRTQAERKQDASYNKENKENKENEENKECLESNLSRPKFDFKSELLLLGVTEQTASDFMEVRKQKKSANTQTAFNRIKAEVNKAVEDGVTAEECITMAVENSWQGFSYEWYRNRITPQHQNPLQREPSATTKEDKVVTGADIAFGAKHGIEFSEARDIRLGKTTLEAVLDRKRKKQERFNLYG